MRNKLLERARQKYAPSIGTLLCLLIVSLLPLLLGCSTVPSSPPIPALEASLAADCPALPPPPVPLVDPERSVWEQITIALYGDCAGRHHHAVAAWPKSK